MRLPERESSAPQECGDHHIVAPMPRARATFLPRLRGARPAPHARPPISACDRRTTGRPSQPTLNRFPRSPRRTGGEGTVRGI